MSKIELKQLSFAYDNQEALLFDQANITMDTNWKLGLIGRNGRGKTTLLRLLQKQLDYQGEILHQVDFVYFPQTVAEEQPASISEKYQKYQSKHYEPTPHEYVEYKTKNTYSKDPIAGKASKNDATSDLNTKS